LARLLAKTMERPYDTRIRLRLGPTITRTRLSVAAGATIMGRSRISSKGATWLAAPCTCGFASARFRHAMAGSYPPYSGRGPDRRPGPAVGSCGWDLFSSSLLSVPSKYLHYRGSLDIVSRVVSAGECARPVVVTAFVHGELCLGESSRPVSALPLFSAPVPVLPADPPHSPPGRSRFAHAALSSSSRPSSLRAYIDRPRPPCLPLVPRRRRPPALLHGGVLP
jgi:hypothetical protein